jgi:DNA-binding CsgD family transcriptional regulator
VSRGWRWICPGCKARVRVIFLPVRPINLAEYFGVRPEVDGELDAVEDSPRVFGCTRCHRVRYFSRVDRCGWNALIGHATGGLLYGHEVRRPEYWRPTRRRAYRPSAKRAPSKRRAEVLAMLREGRKVKEIAAGLGIAVNTVAGHMKVIYRELGVHSRRELREVGAGDLPDAAVGGTVGDDPRAEAGSR